MDRGAWLATVDGVTKSWTPGEVSEAAGGPGCLELLVRVRTVLSLVRTVGRSQGALNWRIV